jgi:hypothetical protein
VVGSAGTLPLTEMDRPTASTRRSGTRLALVIPDGVGVRNFVLGSFLEEAARKLSVDVLHAINEIAIQHLSSTLSNGAVHWHPLRSDDDRLQEFLRNTLAHAHMRRAGTGLMNLRLKQPIRAPTWGRWAFSSAARFVGRSAASRRGIGVLELLHAHAAQRAPGVKYYRRMFQELKPAIVFCTHQRPPSVVAPVLAARSLGIPTATFIFSWDNLTSKGRIAAPFDHFLVWSELMRQEMMRFYPDVGPERIHITGTPQFEPYAEASLLWSREDFFRCVGADPSRPLICYTGGDVGNVPQDPGFVRVLMQLIRDGRIHGRPQVLLRPSPVDFGSRYASVRADFPELLYARPAWVHLAEGSWADVIPLPEDVRFLANLTQHCDLNINWASTMTLDFAIRDRPVVNVAFDLNGPARGQLRAQDIYAASDHYRPVIELGAARVASSPAELAAHVNAYLGEPSLDREGRRRLVELEVGWPLSDTTRRILEVLERIASEES